MSYGIPPTEAIHLLDTFDPIEIDYFVGKYYDIKQRKSIVEQMNMAETYRVAIASMNGKSGAQSYKKWRMDKSDQIRSQSDRLPAETLFSKLKNKSERKTLFSKLKGGK